MLGDRAKPGNTESILGIRGSFGLLRLLIVTDVKLDKRHDAFSPNYLQSRLQCKAVECVGIGKGSCLAKSSRL